MVCLGGGGGGGGDQKKEKKKTHPELNQTLGIDKYTITKERNHVSPVHTYLYTYMHTFIHSLIN